MLPRPAVFSGDAGHGGDEVSGKTGDGNGRSGRAAGPEGRRGTDGPALK